MLLVSGTPQGGYHYFFWGGAPNIGKNGRHMFCPRMEVGHDILTRNGRGAHLTKMAHQVVSSKSAKLVTAFVSGRFTSTSTTRSSSRSRSSRIRISFACFP